MPLTNLSDEAIKQYENALMARVPAADAVGNTALRRLLSSADQSWTKDRCFAIRNRLIERGQLDSSRGYGTRRTLFGTYRRFETVRTRPL